MTELLTAEPLVAQRLEVGESARWIGDALHWVDVPTGRRFRWAGAEIDVVEYGDVVSAVFDAGTGIGVAGRDALELPDGSRIPLGIAEGRSNDARVDPAGGLWVGTWMPDIHARTARLLRVADGEASLLLGGLTMSNGIGFVGESAYHVDTFARTVSRYRLADGSIAEFADGSVTEEFVSFDDALPDGLTVDKEGGVWVALWGAGCARRYDAHGVCTHEVRTPGASQVSSVALGGQDGRELFLTTAAEDVVEPDAGSVFRVPVQTPGVREHVFNGGKGAHG